LENGISNPGKALTSDSCAKKRLFSPQKEDSTSKVALKAENQKGPDEASYPACQLPGANPLPQTAAQSLPFSGLAAGQNLPFKEEKEGQILPSTWRDRNTNHEDINRVQSTAVPANIVKTVVEEIDGITEKDAKRLVAIALNTHGRDQTYIEQLVKYVTTNPRIENQAACLTSLIKTDRDRTLPGEASLEKRPPKKRAGKSAFWTASDKNIISHPDGTLPFDPPYPGDTAFSELLVSKHLVNDYSKAAYLVRLARDYNVASATLRKLVWQAEGTGVGQRSQSFEKLLNEAIKEAAAVSTNVSRVTLRRPIDFKKYQPGGKYGFLTS
jgi:hypothetical protein